MMRTITGIGAEELTPQIAREAFVGALRRFNNLIDLGEFPPFRRIELDSTGELLYSREGQRANIAFSRMIVFKVPVKVIRQSV